LLSSFKNISEIKLDETIANNTEKEIHQKLIKEPTISDQSSDIHQEHIVLDIDIEPREREDSAVDPKLCLTGA
jgi:hypothetical protein